MKGLSEAHRASTGRIGEWTKGALALLAHVAVLTSPLQAGAYAAPSAAEQEPGVTLAAGAPAQVAGTDGIGLGVRTSPSVGADMVGVLADGATVEILTAPRTAEGERWYMVRSGPQEYTGWVRGQYLTAIPAISRPTTSATATPQAPRSSASTIGAQAPRLAVIPRDVLDPCGAVQEYLHGRGVDVLLARQNPFTSHLFQNAYP
jgi:hypothetical protein